MAERLALICTQYTLCSMVHRRRRGGYKGQGMVITLQDEKRVCRQVFPYQPASYIYCPPWRKENPQGGACWALAASSHKERTVFNTSVVGVELLTVNRIEQCAFINPFVGVGAVGRPSFLSSCCLSAFHSPRWIRKKAFYIDSVHEQGDDNTTQAFDQVESAQYYL